MRNSDANEREDDSRQAFLEGLNADFAALHTDATKWKAELEERAAWDATLSDDLEE